MDDIEYNREESHRLLLANLELYLSTEPEYQSLGLPVFKDLKPSQNSKKQTYDNGPLSKIFKKEHEREISVDASGNKFEKRVFRYYTIPIDLIISKNWSLEKNSLTFVLIDGPEHSLVVVEDLNLERIDVYVRGGQREPNDFEKDIFRVIKNSAYFSELPGDNIYE